MRWKANKLREGQTKYVKRFAFLPTKVDDESLIIWLEFYTAREVYFHGWNCENYWQVTGKFSQNYQEV